MGSLLSPSLSCLLAIGFIRCCLVAVFGAARVLVAGVFVIVFGTLTFIIFLIEFYILYYYCIF